jgi:hypothetical protein
MASAFAVESGHKVARLLKYFDGPPYNIPELLDDKLAEVREVLEGIRGFYGTADCWCDSEDDAPHFEHCQRARALYERLRIE